MHGDLITKDHPQYAPYEDFIDENYYRNIAGMSQRSKHYSTKMNMIKERSKRHDKVHRNQIYSSDVPALKKLEILEKREINRQKRIA